MPKQIPVRNAREFKDRYDIRITIEEAEKNVAKLMSFNDNVSTKTNKEIESSKYFNTLMYLIDTLFASQKIYERMDTNVYIKANTLPYKGEY